MLPGHRPPARTPCTGENALLGRGHSRKPRLRKHLGGSTEPRKTVQQMLSTQRVSRHGLRAFHGRHCWTLGRPVCGAFVHTVFRLTRSSLPCSRRAARHFSATPGCFQFFGRRDAQTARCAHESALAAKSVPPPLGVPGSSNGRLLLTTRQRASRGARARTPRPRYSAALLRILAIRRASRPLSRAASSWWTSAYSSWLKNLTAQLCSMGLTAITAAPC